MNAIDLLKQDHQKVKQLFKQIEEADDKRRRQQLFSTIAQELELHTKREEKVFYPPLKDEETTRELVLESYQEHHQVDVLLRELSRMDPGTDEWKAKLTVLQEDVEHHVEEEEGELFPKARKALGQERLQGMGEQMEQIKASA